uniref:Complex 1 LYR protein domain-containing protein n=1 Tax=Cyprinodon variegatus TaxID=28743 RepID=A0A3Q2FN57_CYPVA
MAASTRSQVISLYRMMLKESSKFPSYNYSWTTQQFSSNFVGPTGRETLLQRKTQNPK